MDKDGCEYDEDTDQGVSSRGFAGEESAQAKVSKFDYPLRSDEHVGRFYICPNILF